MMPINTNTRRLSTDMKKLFYIFIVALVLFNCNKGPLNAVAKQENHYNHQLFEENKLPPRATYFGFETAEVLNKEESKRFLSLNGEWKFHFVTGIDMPTTSDS